MSMLEETLFVEVLFIVSVLGLVVYIIYCVLKNPFSYPYFTYSFDVSGKRNVSIEECIDRFLLDEDNWNQLRVHQIGIQAWKQQKESYVQKCILRKYRSKQLEKVIDDEHAYQFLLVRKQTRYQQQNYVRTSYKVDVIGDEWAVSWRWLVKRCEKLAGIGYETTLKEYHSKNQRKLMTPSLRRSIMERDYYTCQICGKYMPDEVGLHIDHIVPIAKGGKSVPSNLHVLCSKCNGRKGAK